MLALVAETDEHLLARWRETLTALRGYDGQQLDPVDRQTRNELRQQLERAEAELDRRGLRTTPVTPSGPWQPLPLHERPPEVSPVAVEPTWEPRDELVSRSELRILLNWRMEEEDWPFLDPALVREWEQEKARVLPLFSDAEPLMHRRPAPFVPELRDGLTAAQRLLFERLGHGAASERQLLADPPGEHGSSLEQALAELRLPRRVPLLVEHDDLLELAPLAREMLTVESGRVQVHGGFFPNLLVNGVAELLAFPAFRLERILDAAGLLASYPGTPDQDLMNKVGLCVVDADFTVQRTSSRFGIARGGAVCVWVEPWQWRKTKALEFHFATAADAERAAERLRLAQERHEFADGTSHALFDGTKLSVTLPPGTHGFAVVRRLLLDRALESWWHVNTSALDADGIHPRSVREMLVAFVRQSRNEVERRLRLEALPGDDRLEVVEGLLRVAKDERLAALVDGAATRDEASWALTHLGSLELAAHPRLGRSAVPGEPFSDRQAAAIISTTGLHRKLHLLELEHEALLKEAESRLSPFRASEIDRLLLLEFARVAALARDGKPARVEPRRRDA